jgi:hypothetical protein
MKTLIFLLSLLLFSSGAGAQNVGINNDGSDPDNSAMLDVKSTDKGFLPPRIALTATNSANPVTTPADGLLVYNTATAGASPNNVVPGYYYWNGTAWIGLTFNAVPYSGASGPVDLGAYDLSVNGLTVGRGSGNDLNSTATGAGALFVNTTGSDNTATGKYALWENHTGSYNTASGARALGNNMAGSYNTATGADALEQNTNGSHNTATGRSAMRRNNTGSYNTATGAEALYMNTGNNNTATGAEALYNNSETSDNTAIGAKALYNNIGSYNTATGAEALYNHILGTDNTAIGAKALRSDISGAGNTAIGKGSLSSNVEGNYNTAIGFNADVNAGTLSNTTAIGYGAIVTASNTIQLGNTSVTNVTTSGTITAGTVTYPNSAPLTDGKVLAANADGSAAWVDLPSGSKTFVINHPTKPDSYLVHACLEGPEAGVYYRGEAKIENNRSVTVTLPDYASSLASNFTIQITPIYTDDSDENITYSTSRVKGNSFSVRGKNGSFYWVVYGQRGTIVVAPKKADVQVFGDGPYKYIKHLPR